MNQLLVASSPNELVAAQNQLIAEIDSKRELAISDAQAAAQMVEDMQTARLAVDTAKRIHKRATARVGYLTKVGQALRAGYLMMPDMPGDVLAVRTDRDGPTRRHFGYGWRGSIPDEPCRALPSGEGRYVSPEQTIEKREQHEENNKGEMVKVERHYPIALRDPDGLDKKFMRPEVMNRTAKAMALKLFDEVVTVRNANTRRKNRDPIVLGRVVDTTNNVVSAFLIAWFVDAKEL